MYYHNGQAYNIGDVITTLDGVFGRVEVAYKLPARQLTWFGGVDQETPQVEAYTLGQDRRPLVCADGKTVKEAIKALYSKLAEIEARCAVKTDKSTVNGAYADLLIDNRVTMLFCTAEDPRMCARQLADKWITTRITAEQPLTLERCQELARKVSAVLGQTVTKFRAYHRVDAGEGKDVAEYRQDLCGEGNWSEYITHLIDREYAYNVMENSLLVSEGSAYLYANDNGVICDDPVAIEDTLGSDD